MVTTVASTELSHRDVRPYPALRTFLGNLLERQSVPYFVSSIILFVLLAPILFIILTSFKGTEEVFTWPPTYIPKAPTLDAYRRVFLQSPLPRNLLNSLIISIGTTSIAIPLAVFTTYGIVQYRFMGAGAVHLILLVTRVIPPVALIIPFFILLAQVNLIDTYRGLILLQIFLGYPLAVWLLKPFFEAFPRELIWAGLIDGCSRLRIFFYIVFPLVSIGIAAVATIVFLWTWNEFLFALVFTSSYDVQPVTVGLRFFIGDEFVEWNAMAGAGLFASLPGLILFLFAQRAIVKGLTSGAVQG